MAKSTTSLAFVVNVENDATAIVFLALVPTVRLGVLPLIVTATTSFLPLLV